MRNKIEIFSGFWSVSDVRDNPSKIFIFGDNDMRSGKGGQAIIRGLSNAIGIRTKKAPNYNSESFYTDSELDQNRRKIFEDINEIKLNLMFGSTIVLSSGGYGTDRARLEEKAPKTFEYLCQMLRDNLHFDNRTGKKWTRIPSHNEILNAKELSMNYEHAKITYGQESPGYFRKELVDSGVTTTFDAIKKRMRTATTRKNELFKAGDIVKFVSKNTDECLICRVTVDSYPVKSISKEEWSKLEGWDISYFKLNPGVEDKFQFHFEYICSIQNGIIKFADGAF